jgi:hypothetical protein
VGRRPIATGGRDLGSGQVARDEHAASGFEANAREESEGGLSNFAAEQPCEVEPADARLRGELVEGQRPIEVGRHELDHARETRIRDGPSVPMVVDSMRRENLAGAYVNPRSTRRPPISVKALACDLQKSKQRTGVSNLPHAAVDTVGRSISLGVQPGGLR